MSEHGPTTNGVTETSRVLDERLRRLFQPPTEERLAEIADYAVKEAVATPPRHPARVYRGLAAAAAVACGVVGIWLIGRAVVPTPGNQYTQQAWQSLDTAYHDWLAAGFEPMWVCADDREFIDTFRTTYRQGLVLDDLPDGVETLGLSYCNCLSGRTTALLATVDGTPVVVFIDRVERDNAPTAPAGFHLHRRRIDGLVLYEMSPLEQPAVLPWFRTTDTGDD